MIAVVGAAGTIGQLVVGFLESWGTEYSRRDTRLTGDEYVDAADPSSVAASLAGASVCVNCVDYRLNVPVMRGALAAGAHYVDLGGLYHETRRQLELHDEFRGAGLTAVLGMGSAPGKTNLLAQEAVRRLAMAPTELSIWAASRDPLSLDHPFPAPYSVQTLRDELSLRPVVVRDGAVVEVEPLSGAAERDFPEPIGRARGILTLHSELATLPAAYPTLREASFRLCLAPRLLEKLLALDGNLPRPYVQSEQAVAMHLVDVAGGGRRVVGMTITSGGSARSTAEPAARAAVELAAGRLASPGVHAPEAAVPDAAAFLGQLETEVRWQ